MFVGANLVFAQVAYILQRANTRFAPKMSILAFLSQSNPPQAGVAAQNECKIVRLLCVRENGLRALSGFMGR